jgi:N-acyl-D-aspartate/D-glutamate deacylase
LARQLFSLSGYGWAARFLQHYVRERRVLSLAEAIRRLTTLPASRLGLADRGQLKTGAWADITVFSAERIAGRFTVAEPRSYPGGIVHVMVNGELAMHDGCRTDQHAGRVLREFTA